MVVGAAPSSMVRRRLILVASAAFLLRAPSVFAQAACPAPTNVIACENTQPGNPSSEWDISGAGDPTLQGFATSISVDKGNTVHFKVDTTAATFAIDVYRLGYYGGLGARKVAAIPSVPGRQQPACTTDAETGLVDCGNWIESASWTVPAQGVSGVYIARLSRADTGGASHIAFVVRDDERSADLLFQTSDTTWQAYNAYGGNSLYVGGPGTNPARAYKVSYNRPITTRDTSPGDWLFNAEYPMIRWLEANGYDVSYAAAADIDRDGAVDLPRHGVFMSVGHDEYWTAGQRTNVEAARASGVHLAFFSGDEIFWKARWEPALDGTPYRTLVCYKETHANTPIDPDDPPTWTGSWRDPRFSPPADGGRPETALTGQLFMVNCCSTGAAIQVPQAFANDPIWRHTRIASLAPGATATLTSGTLGYEWDEPVDNGWLPAGIRLLSSTTLAVDQLLTDYGSTVAPGTATHAMTLYRFGSGALVFGAGTIQFSWGLDWTHDGGGGPPDPALQQATVNLLSDMGVHPLSLQATLVEGPQSTITAPASNALAAMGGGITVSGVATSDTGQLVAVEISVDGGATWHTASGTSSWTYRWTPSVPGTFTIKSRATDDSAVVETPSRGVTVAISPAGCPCSIWDPAAGAGPLDDEAGMAELGVKFESDLDGAISALRFFKYPSNTGPHVGNLWTADGTLLASVPFGNESVSGWQEVALPSPVPIRAHVTYVASYHTSSGFPAVTEDGLSSAVDRVPLHAVADAASGGNGVFAYGATSAFPNQSWNASNYWVDVVFAPEAIIDTSAPVIVAATPAVDAVNVATTTNVTVTFNESIDPTTIGAVTLVDAASRVVPSVNSYDASALAITSAPLAALAAGANYTVTVAGGAAGVRDLAGNAMTSSVAWTFTTAPPAPTCPCSIWDPTGGAGPVDAEAGMAELGVKFQSDVDGQITALRFYKYPGNDGPHVGNLWTADGTLLASVPYGNETASGWQEVVLPLPIAISANTTYVASYHTDSGFPAVTLHGLAAPADRAPLHALSDAASGGNGVFVYGATSAFPTQSWNASNYWVDVVFVAR